MPGRLLPQTLLRGLRDRARERSPTRTRHFGALLIRPGIKAASPSGTMMSRCVRFGRPASSAATCSHSAVCTLLFSTFARSALTSAASLSRKAATSLAAFPATSFALRASALLESGCKAMLACRWPPACPVC